MDSRDGPVKGHVKRVDLYATVPGELKYLVKTWQITQRLPSFSLALQRLLETHPDLAKLAAELYTRSRITGGLDETPPTDTGDSPSDRRTSIVAGLFLGQLRCR